MDIAKLFEQYPKACDVVKSWFLEKMIESFQDDNVPDDFKDFVRKQGIETDKVIKIIGSNPRSLFQVMDENKLFIEIKLNFSNSIPSFSWSVNSQGSSKWFETRTEAELEAVIECLKQLNEK